MRSVLLVAAIALMSGAALATAQVNDNLPLSFHCGEAFITIHRTVTVIELVRLTAKARS